MNHQEKVAAVIRELSTKGIGKWTIAPPLFRLMWSLGVPIPPPYFLGFSSLALIMGVFFAVLLGILMWFLTWSRQGLPISGAIIESLMAGAIFGVAMASYYRWKARKLCLPAWQDYGKDS